MLKLITTAWFLLACIAGAALLAVPSRAQEIALTRYQYTQLHMGVQVRIVLYAPDAAAAEGAATAAFRRFAELEDIMSDYRPTSELMRLCARAGSPVTVSPDLFRVLSVAQDMSRRTGGAFDVTVGPLVQLWRKARKSGQMPDIDSIATARSLVGWEKMRLDPAERSVYLPQPGMRLDLGGIAKGYAADEALAVMRRLGVSRALIEAGGDIVCGDAPPGEHGWSIEVPNAGRSGFAPITHLANEAISTSGDTEQFVEIGGKRYSHVVDPHTGLGLTTRAAATVIAPRGLLSDPLSTAASILGEPRARALIRTLPATSLYMRTAAD